MALSANNRRHFKVLAKLRKQAAKIKKSQDDNDDHTGPSGKVVKSNITGNGSVKMKTSKGVIHRFQNRYRREMDKHRGGKDSFLRQISSLPMILAIAAVRTARSSIAAAVMPRCKVIKFKGTKSSCRSCKLH